MLSLNPVYNYGMISVTERRPFSELGDQQLLEQTRRLAANQRCLEVHILDHLDEIDRRGLALRRGFSSLFDYAVRELRFTDAAAQRRIQAMRLCRRHGWVRASLQSGELSMTAATQLETTFAGAERAERQSRTGRRNVGQGRGHDQDHDSAGQTRQLGLPVAPGEAGEQGERGARAASGLAPRAEQFSGDAAAVNTPVVPVASHAVAHDRGAGHAGTLLPRPESNGNASPFPAPSCDPVAVPVAVPAAPSSDEDPAPQLLPPMNLPASAPVPEREPEPERVQVVAPSESRHTASRAPESSRDDPFAELSPGRSSAPLLHPQLQRELIEQATGMSTRQVASLLAAAAPEVLPPRDTLRATAPDRYTLKVTIDQECEQGLRLLKDLMSHVDPRMSWGDLVARLVRDAVTRHDPRGGSNGQRRRSTDNAGASPRRAPNKAGAAGAAAGPAQRVQESSGRAPNRTRAAGAAAGLAQRVHESSPQAPNRTRTAVTPVAQARRKGGASPAPQSDTAATERQDPIAMLASAAPPSQSAPAALADGALAGGVPSGAPAAPAPQPAAGALVDGSHPGAGAPISPVVISAPGPVLGAYPDSEPPDASAGAAGGPRRMALMRALVCRVRRSSLRRRRRHSVCPLTADRAAPQPEQWPMPRRMAPMRALACQSRRSLLRRPSRHSPCPLTADRAARLPEQRAGPRRMASLRALVCRVRRSPLRRRRRHSVCPLTADRAAPQPEQWRTRPANLLAAAANPRRGATSPRLSGAMSGYATVDAAVIVIRSPGVAVPLFPSAADRPPVASRRGGEGGGVAPSRLIWLSADLLTTECATATDRLRRQSPRCSASSALPPRRSTALADSLQVARRETLRSAARPACIFASASSDPARSLSMRSCTAKALAWSPVNDFLPLPAFAPVAPCGLAGPGRSYTILII